MRRIIIGLALCPAIVLAACGGSGADADGDGEITAEEAVTEASGMVKPRPGQYSSSVELVDFDLPGADPQQVAAMRGMMEGVGRQTHSFCLTEAEADEGFRKMAENMQNGDCTIEEFDASVSKIDAQMTCNTEQGAASVKLTGTGTAESSEMTMDMSQTSDMIPGGEMQMVMKVTNRRTGECEAGADG